MGVTAGRALGVHGRVQSYVSWRGDLRVVSSAKRPPPRWARHWQNRTGPSSPSTLAFLRACTCARFSRICFAARRMLTLSDISKAYGLRTLFADVTLTILRTDRLGFVGANGVGKSTLFSVIRGEESPDTGEITWERGARFGFLPQESIPVGDETVLQLACGQHVTSDHPHGGASPTGVASEAGAPGDRALPVEHHDEIDFTLEPRAKQVLAGLGFRQGDFDRPARTFSGGWVMRAHLARLLVAQPDLLLLDEPTNHLDLSALLWFQDYLSRYPGGLMIISHDRAFLNALCTGVLELRSKRIHRWSGNYDDFIRQREALKAQQASTFKNQQREIAHVQSFVDRFRAKASLASRAQSKLKHVERLKEEAIDAPEDDAPVVKIRFPQPPRSGLKVITLTGVTQAYGDKVVYRDLDFTAERGQRLVLVGPNGAGKSTLLKILAGVVPILGGAREPGYNVRVGYFAQNRVDTLNPQHTALEEIMEMRTENADLTELGARTLLGSFLFRKDDVFKKVAVLSVGEKSRLALAKLLVAPPNLLLMDEPTTHLDIPSCDALIGALEDYTGTLIFISHDVYFIRQIARQVLHIDSGRLTPYAGNYDYFLEKSGSSDARAALEAHTATAVDPDGGSPDKPDDDVTARSGPKTREQRRAEAEARAERAGELKRLRGAVAVLEQEIVELEDRQIELTGALESPETYTQAGKALALNRELSHVVDRLQAANADWEKAASALQAFEGG
jgi:ATP-binding cassette subfamily F protein 3